MEKWQQLWTKPGYRWPILFFTVYLISGLALYGEYGMSWDEALQRQHGFVSAEYVNQKFELQDKQYDWRQLHEYMYRYHGVWFTLPMAWLEEAWELNTFRQQFRMRHLSVFLLYWFAGITFFSLLRSRFGHWGGALLGSAFWLLSPRFFAHAFFNPKDIPFLSLFVISTWTLFRLWLRPGIRTAVHHAFVCGMLIGMRIIGILMPVMTIFLFVADAFVGRKGTRPSGIARSLGIGSYLPLAFGFTVVFWP
ncbi:MAG: glycosyltransferase family 39 protein, partial [Phaeodactylibacter sp.]|nr:glycosyltransferase family 39 protein [Phaeodactylibacter sp.]